MNQRLVALAAGLTMLAGCNRNVSASGDPPVAIKADPTTSSGSSASSSSGVPDEDELCGGKGDAAANAEPSASANGVKVPTGEVSTEAVGGEVAKVKNADAVVARNRWRFKACYTKALATDPAAGGAVAVAVTVGEAGFVTSAKQVSSTLSASLTACIVAAMASMRFDEPTGGSAKLIVKMTLSAKK